MRPLLHPALPDEVRETWRIGAALIQSFGPFCALSERPLPDGLIAWNSDRGDSYPDTIAIAEDWTSFLPIAPELAPVPQLFEPGSLALPHQEITFSLDRRLYAYAPADVELVLTDEDGSQSVEQRTLVVVSGLTDAAIRTIMAFRLNGAGYDAAQSRLTMPRLTYLATEDHLIFRRTEAWGRAEAAIDLIEGISDPGSPLVAQLRMLAGSIGYWSCWATILIERGVPEQVIAAILGGQSVKRVARVARPAVLAEIEAVPQFYIGHGPHNSFPGTDPRWTGSAGEAA